MAEAWKAKIRKDLEAHKEFPGLPEKSIPYFDRMIDRGFFTINSQEGVVEKGLKPLDLALFQSVGCSDEKYVKLNGKYKSKRPVVISTERAYVTGFMPVKQAKRFSYFLNLTDKVAIVDVIGSIPVSYAVCFPRDDNDICPEGEPYPATAVTANSRQSDLQPRMNTLGKKIGKNVAFVQCFDPKHGRAARGSLYKDVIRCLDSTIESLKGKGQ